MALRVQIPPHPPGYASRCGSGCIDGYTGERSASGSTMECSLPPIPPLQATYTILTSGWYAVSGMVGTMRVVKTDNDLVYHRNGICVPGSLPFLNLEARALSRSPHNQGSRDSLVELPSTQRTILSRTARARHPSLSMTPVRGFSFLW